MTFALFLQEKGIELEAFEAKSSEDKLPLLKEHGNQVEAYIKSLGDNIGDKMSKEEIEKLQSEQKTVFDREMKEVKTAMSDQGIAIKQMLDHLKGGQPSATAKAQIENWIQSNAEEITALKDAKTGSIEMTVKAVATVTTGSASNPDGIPEIAGVQMAAPGNANLRGAIVDGLVSSFNTNLSAYPYSDTLPKEGAFDWVGEAGTKPQIDLSIETRYASPKKVAAHMVLTEEAVTDIPGMQSIATNFLKAKHDLKRQNGILFGTGTGAEPTGATVYGRLFVAGGMALQVDTPNFMDVVNATITDIYTTHNYVDEMPYMANIVMVNPIDFFVELVSAKDANGLPLFPTASLFNRVVIGGVTIVPEETIPAGKIFTADMSKYNVSNYVPYSVRIGWINDDFIKNQFCIVGESRLHAYVKHLDEQAFIYDDIATIKTAITKV